MENKVKRASNFNEAEVELLLNAVKKYATILECKKSNSLGWKKKKNIWDKIEAEFNSESSHVYRDAECLKKKYENLKKITKKKYADQKCDMLATGGGPPAAVVTNYIEEELLDLLNTQVTGLPSQFDADTVEQEENDDNNQDVLNTNTCNVGREEVLADGGLAGASQWKNYSPELLKTPKSAPLQVRNSVTNKSVNKEWSLLATTKTTTLKEMRQQAAEKWRIEKEFLLEEQDMKRQKLSLEIEEARLKKQCREKELVLLDLKIMEAKNNCRLD